MGTLVFMPWATVSNGGRVGEFELKPVLVDPQSARRDERDWLSATHDVHLPLLVKLGLADEGMRPLTNPEQDDLAIFDLLLACENLFGAAEELDGIPLSFQWNRARLDGLLGAQALRKSTRPT